MARTFEEDRFQIEAELVMARAGPWSDHEGSDSAANELKNGMKDKDISASGSATTSADANRKGSNHEALPA